MKYTNKDKDKLPQKYKIIHSPSEEDLRPTEQQKQEISKLLNWKKRSRLVDWIVGVPNQPF